MSHGSITAGCSMHNTSNNSSEQCIASMPRTVKRYGIHMLFSVCRAFL